MPKVEVTYYAEKEREILEAAKRVCRYKPLYKVTMRDIVTESGMSQGGVYKYFGNINEVIVALLNDDVVSETMKSDIDALFAQQKEPMDILVDFMQYIGGYIKKSIIGSGKIHFELMILCANEPDRFHGIRNQLLHVSVLSYVQTMLTSFIRDHIDAKFFEPTLQVEDIMAFVTTAINGITHEALLAHNASGQPTLVPAPDIDRLMNCLTHATCSLLGRRKP